MSFWFSVRLVTVAVLIPLSLVAQTTDAVPGLIQKLRSGNYIERAFAAAALGQSRPDAQAAVYALVEALKDPDEIVRDSAVRALGNIGPAAQAAVPPLSEALKDSDRSVRTSAAWSLGNIGSAAGAAVPALVAALKKADPIFRKSLTEALVKIGPAAKAAVPSLIPMLKDRDYGIRDSAFSILRRIDTAAAVLALVGELKDSDQKVRLYAAEALGEIGPAAKVAVPALVEALRNTDRDVDSKFPLYAATALGEIGPAARPAVPALIDALNDSNSEVRHAAAAALGGIGPGAQAAVPALIHALKGDDSILIGDSAEALGRIGPAAQAAVPALIEILNGGFENLFRDISACALGKIGAAAQAALPILIEALKTPNQSVRNCAASALVSLAKALQDAKEVNAIERLQEARNALQDLGFETEAADIRRAVESLTFPRDTLFSKVLAWAGQHRWGAVAVVIPPLYLVWLLVLRLVILPNAPLRLLDWNEALAVAGDPVEVEVSAPGVKMKLSLRYLLKNASLISCYHFHPKVLEAWVEKRIDAVLAGLQNLTVVKSRSTFVILPVVLNGKLNPSLDPASLQEITARNRWCVLVKGEGGLGKTTLALQLALSAMAEDPAKRLCRDRKMLPVLLEPDIKFDVRSDVPTFKRELRGKLQQLSGAKEPVSELLFDQLLRDRRVLVILDGLSEMLHAPAGPGTVRPEHPDFPVNALVVTSRGDEKLNQELTMEPQRIDSTHLLGFINSYLTGAGQTGLTDSELFDASRRLADLVTIETGITSLLARLFAEQLIGLQRRKEPIQRLPRSVPDLMLAYINSLNRDRKEGDPDDPTLHRAAKLAAWECLSATFRPGQSGSKEAIRAALAQAQLDTILLDRLETLGVVKTLEPAKTHVRFELDPLSEYLAAMKRLEDRAQNPDFWSAFFKEADGKPGAPGSIRGFLLATWDCCQLNGPVSTTSNVPIEELARRACLDPVAITAAQYRKRAEQLIRYLTSSEPADRAHAADELSLGGPVAEIALPALVGCITNEDIHVRCEAAAALAAMGHDAQVAVPALTELLKSDDLGVRVSAASVLRAVAPQHVSGVVLAAETKG